MTIDELYRLQLKVRFCRRLDFHYRSGNNEKHLGAGQLKYLTSGLKGDIEQVDFNPLYQHFCTMINV